jgi:glycosyltransferase involved in cell wall biosynthesis
MARWKAVNWTRYHQIFTQLAKLGHNVHIIQAPANNSRETNFQEIDVALPENLYLHEIDINPFIWNRVFPLNKIIKKGYYSFKCINKVKKMIKDYNIDVLFLYNIPQYPLMKVNSCLKVFDFADDYLAMLRHELGMFNNKLALGIGKYLLGKMVEKSDVTLVISQVLADSINGVNSGKVKVLPNGVNLNGVASGCGAEIRAKYNTPLIGFIGSFEYFIDFELILNTAERFKEYTFLLVGSGRDFAFVTNQIKYKNLKNVILTGGVPNSEIVKYIDAMDVCLNIFKKIPISHAACPIKLFEYLSMKKPVISTRLKELENIDKGFLFYADTKKEICEQIATILTNSDLTRERIEKGYNLVKAQYQWELVVKDFLKIIETKKEAGKC